MNKGHNRNYIDLIISGSLLLVAVAALLTAYTYSGGSGVFPRFIGWIFLAFCLLEFSIQLVYLVFRPSEEGVNHAVSDKRLKPDTVLSEIKGFLWLGLLLVLIYLAGFIITIPVYTFAFFRIAAHKPVRECIMLSAALTAFIYILFVWLLEYRLFPGILAG